YACVLGGSQKNKENGEIMGPEWYLPVSVAAEILGCHRRDIYVLLESGQLSYIRLPDSKIKVSEQSILKLFRILEDS
ncbi:MAG: helix-turn-helix domain-containing protein, partial [Syntrophobacteraceae bacterium]